MADYRRLHTAAFDYFAGRGELANSLYHLLNVDEDRARDAWVESVGQARQRYDLDAQRDLLGLWCRRSPWGSRPQGKEITIDSRPEAVWGAIRDVGAVHRVLLPDRVANTELDGDSRILTFSNGAVVRELLVTVDDEACRLAYTVVEGSRLPITHHHAFVSGVSEGTDRSRLVWITDVLPHTLAAEIRARLERGAADMKRTLEVAAGSHQQP